MTMQIIKTKWPFGSASLAIHTASMRLFRYNSQSHCYGRLTRRPFSSTSKDRKSLLFVGLGNHGSSFESSRHNMGMILLDSLFDLLLKVEGLNSYSNQVSGSTTGTGVDPRSSLLAGIISVSCSSWRQDRSLGGSIASCLISLPAPTSANRKTSSVNDHGNPIIDDPVGETVQVYLFKPRSLMNICGPSVKKAANSLKIKPDRIVLVHDDLDRSLGKVSWKNGGSASGHNGVRSVISSLQTAKIPRLRAGIGRPAADSSVSVADYVLDAFTASETLIIENTVVPTFTKEFQKILATAATRH